MKLYAISDIHLGYEINRNAFATLAAHPQDWLILAGDIGETTEQLEWALEIATSRFAQVLWVPGNHDLWTLPTDPQQVRGEAKYFHLVSICQKYGVLTPEDPYVAWPGAGVRCLLAPLFLLYDYSFRPPTVPLARAVAWAEEAGVVANDEFLLHPDPYRSRAEWCAARCTHTAERLQAASAIAPLILINHFPLRQDLVRLKTIPRFSLWCGTTRTEDWHTRFPTLVVVSGHVHIRSTDYRDGVRFEEVSLGYPQQWQQARGINAYLREILTEPDGITFQM